MPTRLDATLALDSPASALPGVASKRQSGLTKLGISTLRDLLAHYPRRYIDLTKISDIARSPIGDTCTIVASVHDVVVKNPRPRLTIVEIHVVDNSGLMILTFFNQKWLANKYKVGMRLSIAGKVEFSYGYKRMTHPIIEDMTSLEKTGSVVSVYPATAQIATDQIRKLVAVALQKTKGAYDPLPLGIRARRGLVSRGRALEAIHAPKTMSELAAARARLAYEELLYLEIYLQRKNIRAEGEGAPVEHVVDGPHMQAFRAGLPFVLSLEQIKAVDEILDKMAAPQVANHMLMGDVGCGKTIVSAFGLAAAKDTGGQAFMLAPTEVLATQHFASLGSMLEAAGISVALLCGSTPAAVRESILERLKTGELDVLIGTHALLEDDVRPKNLTFAIIDEQQRFGVEQRAKLLSKGGAVDALSLSATPIPRSLAIATLGNFSISVIKHPARAHAPRVTRVVRKTDRGEAYEAAYKELEVGHQVYVVCPLIGTSDNSQDSDSAKSKSGAAKHKAGAQSSGFDTLPDDEQEAFVDIDDFEQWSDDNPTAAIREARFLEQKIFCPYKVAVLHGGMHADKKAQVMSDFAEGNVQVLVSTTVIEVGIDVAAATVMIIEDADRFGLSQLHQLRGRVGRGGDASQVFLVSSTKREEALARLDYLTHCDNGFELAEFDLSLRREGDILGSRQSGASSLKLVSIARDGDLIDAAWTDAAEILKRDPMLEQPSHKAIAREIEINIEEKVRQEQAQTQARAKAKSGSRSNSKKVHK